MYELEELKKKQKFLTSELNILKEQIRQIESLPTTTKTGKIKSLKFGVYYYCIGQKGQIYSRRITPQNKLQFEYLNNMRRLFMSQSDAEKQKHEDKKRIAEMDAIDNKESEFY